MKIKSILLLFSIPFMSVGQNLKEAQKALKNINSLEQLETFKARYSNWVIHEDKTLQSDSSQFPNVYNAKIGDVVVKQYNPNAPTFALKVLAERQEELCKVKYIYLDGSQFSASQIDSLRTLIIARYNKGEDFESLVKSYTMDGNPTGDLGWFSKGMMVEAFDSAVRSRKKGDLFAVDVPEKNWYYVVLKTYDNKMEKAKVSVMVMYK